MAVECEINVDDAAPAHGQTIVVTYAVNGNDPIDPQQATISGVVVVGGQDNVVTTTITLPGTPAASVSYGQPTCPGLTFVATANPAVFTAVIP